MNISQKTLYLFSAFILIFAHHYSFAQNPNIIQGYYISATGDSISGQIHLEKTVGQTLAFKLAGAANWQDLPATSVKRAGDRQGLLFYPRMIRSGQDSQFVFVRRTVGGGYNLYEGKTTGREQVYFIQSPEKENWIRVNRLGFETQLKTMFAPCSSQASMPKLRYGSTALQRYVSEINHCAYPNTPPYVYKSTPRPRFGIGLSAFYYRIDPKVTTNDGQSYGDYNTFQKPGASLLFKVNVLPAFSVFTGIGYIDKRMSTSPAKQRVEFTVDKPGIPPYQAYDYYEFATELDFRYVEVPMGISYTIFPFRKWSPILNFGLTVQKSVANKVIRDYGDPVCEPCTQPDPGPSDYYYEQEYSTSEFSLANFFGGASLRYQPSNRHQLEMNLSYYHQRELASHIVEGLFPYQQIISMKSSRLQVGLTYYYLLGFK